MVRGLIVLILVLFATLLVFEMCNGNSGAQEADNLGELLENQKLILERLETMDKKLDIIKMRIRL